MSRGEARSESETLVDRRFAEALARHAGGQSAAAEALYRAVLEERPDHVEALGNLAALCAQGGRLEEAVTLCRRVLVLTPNVAAALNTLGIALKRLGRTEEAVASYRAALAVEPDDAATLSNLGLALRGLGRHAESLAPFERAAALRPALPSAQLNLGNALKELGRLDEAERAYRKAISLDADYAEAHSNLGSVLRELGRPDAAEAALQAALRLDPALVTARYNLGNAYKDRARLDDCIAAYREALRIDPDHVPSHWNLSHALLLAGRLEQGFAEYEWRWRLPAMGRHGFSGPQWDVAARPGTRVVIHAEQGFGDAIQFVRYAPLVAMRGHGVTLVARAPLRRLFSGLPGIDVVSEVPPVLQADYHCPLLSLPRAFGTRLETIPAEVPYLRADPAAVERFRAAFADARLKVGLVWRGSPEKAGDAQRSLEPAQLRDLLGVGGVRFVSLQKEPRPGDLDRLRAIAALDDPMPAIEDFADTAALITALDLVIAVDTAVAHLAGALAKPVWLLLPFVPDWRWMLARSDSPWYPTVRLFRQAAPGDWPSALAAAAVALRALARSRIGGP